MRDFEVEAAVDRLVRQFEGTIVAAPNNACRAGFSSHGKPAMDSNKKAVEDKASCDEDLSLRNQQRDGYVEHARCCYELEPIIEEFAGAPGLFMLIRAVK